MKPNVAVIGAGGMGAAVGARLTERGLRVITSTDGRSQASIQRAAAAGMVAATAAEIAQADVILSIVPPKEALSLAQRLAPTLVASNHKPLYADCNAVNPDTAGRIAQVIAETGCPFADAGIIGGPPRAGYDGPVFYASGPEAGRLLALNDYGLIVRVMAGPVGDASALKMSYGGLTKGLTALGSALALAAARAGVSDTLHAELAASQPNLLAWLSRSVPGMYSKAYRWVGEMEEVADFVGPGPQQEIFAGIAELYEHLARDFEGTKEEIGALAEFFEKKPSPGRS
jgi:3-hydroxyisobutyrate dehydrogenase-like beta-hydroxyacid dehydrogenase